MTNVFQKLSNAIDRGLQNFFARLGYKIALRPKTTIALSLLFAAACITGVVKYETESRADKLWSPPDSDPVKHAEIVKSFFPSKTRQNNLYLTAKNTGGNVLTYEILEECRIIQDALSSIVATAATDKEASREWTWDDVATSRGIVSVLDAWEDKKGNFNKTAFLADKNDLTKAVNKRLDSATLQYVLGGIDITGSTVNSAQLLRVVFDLANNAYTKNGQRVDPPGEAWEEKANNYLRNTKFEYVSVFPNTQWGNRDESRKAIKGDLGLVAASIMLIVFYLLVSLGQCTCLTSRVSLALGGLGCVGLALGLSYGLGSLCSPYTPVHSVLPFLIMGIGVDDIFVVVNEYDLTKPKKGQKKTVAERVSEAMKEAGTSITVTTATDFLAFMISSTTLLPALASFCIWAAFAVLGAYIFTCTLFVAFLTLDAQRQEANRYDCCCCFVGTPKENPNRLQRGGFLKSFIDNQYSPLIGKNAFRAVVVVVFLGFAGGAVPQLFNIKQNFRREWFIPSDSYLQDYYTLTYKQFSHIGAPVALYVKDADPFEKQQLFKDMYTSLEANPHISKGLNVSSWYHEFDQYMTYKKNMPLSSINDKTTFDKELSIYFKTEGRRYSGNVVYADDGQTLKMAKVSAFLLGLTNAVSELNAMESLTADAEKLQAQYGLDKWQLFSFGFTYPNWSQYSIIPTEAISNIGLTLMAVFIIVLIFIASPPMALLVTSVVGLALVNILGYMTLWDVDLNGVSVVNLVLSVGLSVDYSAHIGHAFMHKQGTRVERAILAVSQMGISVINGAFSTFLAVCLLSLSTSYVFVVFFKMFFLTCVFGALHGVVFFPVLLSFIGPPAFPEVHAITESDMKGDKELEKGDKELEKVSSDSKTTGTNGVNLSENDHQTTVHVEP